MRTLGVFFAAAGDTLAAYAVTVAHHVRHDLERRNRPRLLDLTETPRPDDLLVSGEEAAAVRAAIAGLPDNEREVLLGHVTEGLDTPTLALATGTTTGGVAARLARARPGPGSATSSRSATSNCPAPPCTCRAAPRAPTWSSPLTERRSVLAGLLPLPLIPAPHECSRADGPIRRPAPSGSSGS